MQTELAELGRLRNLMLAHRDLLARNESATRYAVIDPILSLLGWDVSDPHAVVPEFTYGSARVDYALAVDGRTVALVEAKSLDTKLGQKDWEQLAGYCYTSGVRYGILTDGNQWQVIDGHQMGVPLHERLVHQVTVSEGPVVWVWQALLSLSREGLGATPVRFPEVAAAAPSAVAPDVEHRPSQAASPQPNPTPVSNVRPLTALEVAVRPGSRPAITVAYPGGHRSEPQTWSDLLASTLEWLESSGRLASVTLPIPDAAGRKRYLVALQAVHPAGKPFNHPRRTAGGLFYQTNYAAADCVRNAIHALRQCGVDPATVEWTERSS